MIRCYNALQWGSSTACFQRRDRYRTLDDLKRGGEVTCGYLAFA